MAGLQSARNTESRGTPGRLVVVPVKDGYTLYAGAVAAVGADGLALPAGTAAGETAAGVVLSLSPLGPGVPSAKGDADGYTSVQVALGEFKMDNDSGSACTQADAFQTVYFIDDHTVSHSDPGSAASAEMLELDADGGVWVRIGNG